MWDTPSFALSVELFLFQSSLRDRLNDLPKETITLDGHAAPDLSKFVTWSQFDEALNDIRQSMEKLAVRDNSRSSPAHSQTVNRTDHEFEIFTFYLLFLDNTRKGKRVNNSLVRLNLKWFFFVRNHHLKITRILFLGIIHRWISRCFWTTSIIKWSIWTIERVNRCTWGTELLMNISHNNIPFCS